MLNQDIVITASTVKKFNKWKTNYLNGDYRAYIQAHKSNKFSRRHVSFCPIEGVIQDALSDGERRSFKVLRSDPKTVSVKMQFANDIDETIEHASWLKVRHPANWKTKEAYVMTTDFVVDHFTSSNHETLTTTAFTFKYWDQIYRRNTKGEREKIKRRTWEKFAIEKAFWNSRNIEYRLITEKDATKTQAWNIDFCRSARKLKVSERELFSFLDSFDKHWAEEPFLVLSELVAKVASELIIDLKSAMRLFKYAVLNRFLTIDHTICLQPYHRVVKGSEVSCIELIGEVL